MSNDASEPKHCPKCQAPLPADAPQGLCPRCLLAAASIPTEAGQPVGRPAPPSIGEIAAAFPQLEILEFIGQGGMGFVFKARQPKLDRLVALKILPQSLAADPTFAERFNREAKLLARLSHPGIVTVHDFGMATSRNPDASPQPPFYYLLMEFVDGVNLRQAMQAGRFTPDQALAIVPKICEALQYAHNEGILHRDIKPENILLDAKGRVKIADFGIAKLVGNDGRADLLVSQAAQQHRPTEVNLTEAGKTLGSPNYMAPEQLEHPGEVDHRADIYSLGVVFYEMLTGELPLGRFAPPSQKSAADPRVDEVVLRALEKERERRQHSAGEVKTQVETIVSDPKKAEGVPRHFFPPETPLPKTSFDDTVRKANRWWLVLTFPGIFLLFYLFKGGRLVDFLGSDSFVLSLALMAAFALLTLLSHVRKQRGRIVLVGVSNGKRVINWDGVIQIWVVIYCAAFVTLYLAFGRWVPLHNLLASLTFGVTVITGAWVRGLLKRPIDQLPPGSSQDDEAHSEKSEIGNRKSEIAPRFSRTAIVGAAFLALALILLPFLCWMAAQILGEPGPVTKSWHPAIGEAIFAATYSGAWFLAACGATILGWIAVSQIRRSAGKLQGLRMALFDGLFFPLLALDGLIIWVCLTLARMYVRPLEQAMAGKIPFYPGLFPGIAYYLHRHQEISIFVGIGIALAVDLFVIRRVWRAVNKGGADGSAQVPTAGKPSNLKLTQSDTAKILLPALLTVAWHAVLVVATFSFFAFVVPRFSNEFAKLDATLPQLTSLTITLSHAIQHGVWLLFPMLLALDAGICILMQYLAGRWLRNVWSALVACGCGVMVLFAGVSLYLPLSSLAQNVSPSTPTAAQNLSFGPVIERTLPFHTNGVTDVFGLESNQVVTLPASGRLPSSLIFLDDDDGNAIYINGQLGVSVMPVKNQSWETISTAKSMEMLATKTNLMSFAMVKKSDLPAIFLFKTQRGTAGALKIANSTDAETGLNLNYKFITENSTNAVPFPPQDYSQPVPPTGFKPIPPEAVRLFQQSRELMAAKLFNLPHSETKASLLESAKTQMELLDIGRKLAPLLKGTAFEAAQMRQMDAFQKWQQLDPNKDKEKWNQAEKELHIAQFTEERLMAEAGAADIIQLGAGKLKFGPWKEAVVSHPSIGTNCCVNFDTGVVLTPPTEILTEMTVTNRPGNDFFEAMPESFFWAKYRADSKATNTLARWIEDSNVDAVALGTYGLVVFCPVHASMKIDETGVGADWESQISPAWLLWKLHFAEEMNAAPKSANTYEVLTLPTDTSASTNDLCYFRTRSGTLGILQITGFTENPLGVKIRYKLVQPVEK